MGWRYQYLLVGGVSLVAALIRIFLMKMEESPKWLVATGQFEKAVAVLREIARINGAELTVTVNDFCVISGAQGTDQKNKETTLDRVRGLFATRKLVFSTVGVILLWMCIGVA